MTEPFSLSEAVVLFSQDCKGEDSVHRNYLCTYSIMSMVLGARNNSNEQNRLYAWRLYCGVRRQEGSVTDYIESDSLDRTVLLQ